MNLANIVSNQVKQSKDIIAALHRLDYEERDLKRKLKLVDMKKVTLKRIQQAAQSGKYAMYYASGALNYFDPVLDWLRDLGFEVELYREQDHSISTWIAWRGTDESKEESC